MSKIFVEKISSENNEYSIALIDTCKIHNAQNPGKIAQPFTTNITDRKIVDDAQIFYALAPKIKADDFFYIGLPNLNKWSRIIANRDVPNIWDVTRKPTANELIELYSKHHDISQGETHTSDNESLMTLVVFSETFTWKTGILQRCIDCLLLPQHRCKAISYYMVDKYYYQLMRYKLETEYPDHPNVMLMHKILNILKLKSTHDTTVFELSSGNDLSEYIEELCYEFKIPVKGTCENIKNLFKFWSNAEIVEVDFNTFRIVLDSNICLALLYMQPMLQAPKFNKITDVEL